MKRYLTTDAWSRFGDLTYEGRTIRLIEGVPKKAEWHDKRVSVLVDISRGKEGYLSYYYTTVYNIELVFKARNKYMRKVSIEWKKKFSEDHVKIKGGKLVITGTRTQPELTYEVNVFLNMVENVLEEKLKLMFIGTEVITAI